MVTMDQPHPREDDTMSAITITHTAAEGTLAHGDTRPHAATFKANGWRWGRSITAWYIPHSRDTYPQQRKIAATVAALEAAGATVDQDISADLASVAEREARKAERLEDRQEALAHKAERKAAEADGHMAKVDQIAGMIPFGQPILVGHHSEARARKDQQRIWDGMGKSVAAHRESEEAARKAEASTRNQKHRQSGPATMRRIEKLEAEARDITRRMERSGDYTAISGLPVSVMLANVNDEIAYWRDHLAALEAEGWKHWTPADFKPGDYVLTQWFHAARKVVRVNAKSLSVESGYSWTDKVTYDDISGRIDAAEMAAD